MNKKGFGMMQIAVIILISIIGILLWVIFSNPAFSDLVDRIRRVVEIASMITLGFGIFIFLWKIKFFKILFHR